MAISAENIEPGNAGLQYILRFRESALQGDLLILRGVYTRSSLAQKEEIDLCARTCAWNIQTVWDRPMRFHSNTAMSPVTITGPELTKRRKVMDANAVARHTEDID